MSDLPRWGTKTNWCWYDGLHEFGPRLRRHFKRVLVRNRRRLGTSDLRRELEAR